MSILGTVFGVATTGVSGGLVNPTLIKYGIIVAIILSLVGYHKYEMYSLQNQIDTEHTQLLDVTQKNQILAQDVTEVTEINKKNAEILGFVTKNREFLQKLENNYEIKANQDAQRRKTVQKNIQDEAISLGDKSLTGSLLGAGLNSLQISPVLSKEENK
jgi:hypothetical protein